MDLKVRNFWMALQDIRPIKKGQIIKILEIAVQPRNQRSMGEYYEYAGCDTRIAYTTLHTQTVCTLDLGGKLTEYFTLLTNEKALEVLYGDKPKTS